MPDPKALILDPLYERRRSLGLENLVSCQSDWQLSQLSFAVSQVDPVAFLPRIIEAVEEAEIIICLGDYFWFRFCSGAGSDFFNSIEHKLSIGTPFYLQLIRAHEGDPPPALLISKSAARSILNKINYGLRRNLAHPHKAEMLGYEFDQSDIDDVHAAQALLRLDWPPRAKVR